MDRRAIKRRDFLALLAASGLSVTGRALADHPDPLCIIMAASSAQKELSRNELRRIFLHQPSDDVSGNRFIPLNAPPKSPIRVHLDTFLFGLGPDEMARYWVDQRIRGTQAPRAVPSIDMARKVVAKLPGGITYIPASQLIPEVKALRIDGRGPFDNGYPLRAHS
jgi:hypothetical protein